MRDTAETQKEATQWPSRKIPKGWTLSYLSELAVGGLANGVFKEPHRSGRGLPLINVGDLYGPFGVDTTQVDRFAATTVERQRYYVQPGDIFFTRSSLNLQGIAHCNIVRAVLEPTVFECHLMRLRLDPTSAVATFVAHWCRSPPARAFLMSRAKQVTMTTIAQPDLGAMSVPLPPLPEQHRIAEVLDTIDDAIRKTEQLIQKLKQMKQGLLRDLLTRGVDENGELRDPERHPGQFKDSSLGRIPKEWVVRLVDELAKRGSGHTPNKNVPAYWNGGIKWVSLSDSSLLDRIYIDTTDKEISDLGIANSSAVLHSIGTVIVSRDAGVGKSAILADAMAVSQHFIAWRCGGELDNHFFYFWLQHKKSLFESIAFGSTIKTIGLPFFKRLRLSTPKMPEQQQIARVLLNQEAALEHEGHVLAKLRLLKQGLMEDLLTGRVRARILDGAAA